MSNTLKSPSLRTPSGSIRSGQKCPYLGSVEGPELPIEKPSRRNLCLVLNRTERQGFRKKTVPARISRTKQTEHCLADFSQCSHFQKASQEAEEKARERAASAAPTQKQEASASHKPRSRKRRTEKAPSWISRQMTSLIKSKRVKSALQVGSLGALVIAFAFLATTVIYSNPARWVEFVFDTIIKNDIKAFGLKHAGLKDKSGTAGLVTGGNLRASKLSSKQKAKLKSKFKGLTKAQKAALRKKFKGRR